MSKQGILETILGWIALSRPPFHTVGILPFLLGTLLAWRIEARFDRSIFSLGVLAVILIMLSTYHAGEYFDQKEDCLSKKRFKSRFSGGSGIIPAGKSSAVVSLWTSIISLLLAGIAGITLQFFLKTGSYTLLLGGIGGLSGFLYSTKPVRLVERGVGEIFIGFCYGWLPVAVAFYTQTGGIHPIIHWISIPVAMTIFNVIFLNEFPDYPSDLAVGKKNILVRVGMKKGMMIYVLMSVLGWFFFFLALRAGVPWKGFYLYLPIMTISITLVVMILRRKFENLEILEAMCGANIFVNLGTTASFIFAYW